MLRVLLLLLLFFCADQGKCLFFFSFYTFFARDGCDLRQAGLLHISSNLHGGCSFVQLRSLQLIPFSQGSRARWEYKQPSSRHAFPLGHVGCNLLHPLSRHRTPAGHSFIFSGIHGIFHPRLGWPYGHHGSRQRSCLWHGGCSFWHPIILQCFPSTHWT